MEKEYQDMLTLPHHVSKSHPKMSVSDRAAQFAPFAALTGYGAVIKETARQTDARIELDEYSKAELDAVLGEIRAQLAAKPQVSITYFVPDAKKQGGAYVTVRGRIKKIEEYEQKLILTDEREIRIPEILCIELSAQQPEAAI